MKKNSIIVVLLISCVLFVVFHLFPLYKHVTWKAMIQESNATQFLPRWLDDSQKAYISYKQNNFSEAEKIRGTGLSGNNQYLFNLGTTLAQKSFLSGQLVDKNLLQQAEQYLSGAADLMKNKEIEHNLTIVRKLLEESGTGSESQQQQDQQNSTGDQQQQQNGSGTSQQNEQQQGQGSSSALSPELQQQIEQYKQQLEQEQQANQQFFGKQAQPSSDGFGFLDQLFGGTPQFQQQIDTGGEQDW